MFLQCYLILLFYLFMESVLCALCFKVGSHVNIKIMYVTVLYIRGLSCQRCVYMPLSFSRHSRKKAVDVCGVKPQAQRKKMRDNRKLDQSFDKLMWCVQTRGMSLHSTSQEGRGVFFLFCTNVPLNPPPAHPPSQSSSHPPTKPALHVPTHNRSKLLLTNHKPVSIVTS